MLRKTAWIATFFVVSFHFFPRLVIRGLFGDGLLYSSMARNMAEGRGNFWAPKFSDGYWLDYVQGTYFENPPLMLWMQSLFFRLFGDYWWVEKLFCVPVLALNVFLIAAIWRRIFAPLKLNFDATSYDWLPVLLWFFMPTVIWGQANNLMDNAQLVFCLAAFFFILKALQNKNKLNYLFASFFVFLGLLTKTPLVLYACALPFFWHFFSASPKQLGFGLLQSLVVFLMSSGWFIALLLFSENARHFFQQFWNQRLLAVISGSRSDAALDGFARLTVFSLTTKEILPILGIGFLLYGVAAYKRRLSALSVFQFYRISSLFFACGLAATFPIMLSARQNGMYLLPVLPMFALSAAAMMLPLVHFFMTQATARGLLWTTRFFSLGLLGIVVYCAVIFGKPMRERELQHDLTTLKTIVKSGTQIAACKELKEDFMVHTYLQRFHKVEVLPDTAATDFALRCRACRHAGKVVSEAFPGRSVLFSGEYFEVFGR